MGAVSRGTNDFKPQVRNTKKVLVHPLDESAPFFVPHPIAGILYLLSQKMERSKQRGINK